MKKDKILKWDLNTKRNIWGYFFTFPLIIGIVFFFAYPFFQSIHMSISDLAITSEGFDLNFVGLDNYRYSFLIHPEFVRIMVETIIDMVRNVPLILAFSFFAAILLNQKFRGRFLARIIFFLPVILSAGVVLQMEQADLAMQIAEISPEEGSAAASLIPFFESLRMPEVAIDYVLNAIDVVPDIIRASGVQILIFLAGLQSIPNSLYEASKVEGATEWENFWLITLPLMSPLILTNIVYTVVDFFTSPGNELLGLIQETTFSGAGFGVGSAMSWVYFINIGIFLAIVIGLVSRKVFYLD